MIKLAKKNWRRALVVALLLLFTLSAAGCSRDKGKESGAAPPGGEPAPAVPVDDRPGPKSDVALSLEDLLEPVHPDEPVAYTFHERFSPENALARLEQIAAFGNSATGETAMAFSNWVGAVEGTLRKQDYQIKKLEFELALRRYEAGEIAAGELEERERALEAAESDFRIFWNSFGIKD